MELSALAMSVRNRFIQTEQRVEKPTTRSVDGIVFFNLIALNEIIDNTFKKNIRENDKI